MASTSVSSVLFLLQLVTLAASARAATFLITNNCGFTVWPAAIPVGGGLELGQGQTWTVDVPSGTSNGQIWGRTGCSFNGGSGSCKTGDCGGALRCTSSGQPPRTLAEFDIEASGGGGGYDYYDISVVDGYNLPMAFSCTTGVSVNCGGSSCPDAHRNDNDVRTTTHVCPGNSNYKVTFCP